MLAMNANYLFTVLLLWWIATLDTCQAIMVEFGTSKEPILPREPASSSATKTTIIQPRNLVARSPAPVREDQEDIPNPNRYQPPVPHQYRTKFYSFKPNPNLILGTPLDQRYTPSLQKYDLHRKQYSRQLGPAYTGPHMFEKQDYELYEVRKTTLQPSVRYSQQELQHRVDQQQQQQKNVPQIGIIYSGGVRYYVPQFFYVAPDNSGEEENSVYDRNDDKYFVYRKQ